jgi:hypothetical protein
VSKKQKNKEGPVSLPKTPMGGGREISRRTAFVTGGSLGAFLLLLAIVSVPQKKPFHSNSYCGSYMCRKKRIRMDLKNVIAKTEKN